MRNVVVVGAGVAGLTTAVRLLDLGCRITILTREDPAETTSSVAAALWFPFRAYPLETVVDWSLASLIRFRNLEGDRASGVRTVHVREVYRDLPPPPEWRRRLSGFAELRRGDLPSGFSGGYGLSVPVIDSSRYLPFLLSHLRSRGVDVLVREVNELGELRGEADFVVNCSGVGARILARDESVVPIRGQVLRVRTSEPLGAIVDEGSEKAAYVVPRTDDVILGTTIEEGEWDRSVSESAIGDILSRCRRLDERVSRVEVLESRVGLRPGRPEVRVERDEMDGVAVIHNYGHGGSGFTLSWGCAEDVVRLVEAG